LPSTENGPLRTGTRAAAIGETADYLKPLCRNGQGHMKALLPGRFRDALEAT
jgi:hypothetical protein